MLSIYMYINACSSIIHTHVAITCPIANGKDENLEKHN